MKAERFIKKQKSKKFIETICKKDIVDLPMAQLVRNPESETIRESPENEVIRESPENEVIRESPENEVIGESPENEVIRDSKGSIKISYLH